MELIQKISILVAAVCVIAVIYLLTERADKKIKDSEFRRVTKMDAGQIQLRIKSNDFQRAPMLKPSEWIQYDQLRKYAADKGLIVCPKVRLINLVEPVPDAEDQKVLEEYSRMTHVDFVVCTTDLQVLLIIQLEKNDSTEFVLKHAGYKVITTERITDEILQSLE